MKKEKKFLIQLSLKHKSGLRSQDCLVPTIKKLSIVLYKKMRQLTSSNRRKQWTTKELKLIFLTRNIKSRRPTSSLKVRQSISVPLITDQRETTLVNNWHEVNKKSVQLKLFQAAGSRDVRESKADVAVRVEASNLKRVHIYPHKTVVDEQTILDNLKKLEDFEMPIDPYMPCDDIQLKVLNGEHVQKPAKRTKLSLLDQNIPEDIKRQVVESKNWKQTSISDFFSPKV